MAEELTQQQSGESTTDYAGLMDEAKALEVAYTPGVKEAEVAFAQADRRMKDVNEQGREVFQTGDAKSVRAASQQNRLATENRVVAKVNRDSLVNNASAAYEEEQRNKAV